MIFKATIHVTLKPDVADVQGIAIQQSLSRHGHPVQAVRAGKYFEVEVEASDAEAARKEFEELGRTVFSNPVIERVRVEMA